MSRVIEEAVIIETIEIEPNFEIEIVSTEPVKERRKSLFDSLIDAFFGNSILNDFFDKSNYYDEELSYEEPENAIITETSEKKVTEVHYFYYELL